MVANGMRKRLIRALCLLLFLGLVQNTESKAGQAFLSDWIQTVYGDDVNIPVSSANHVLQTDDGYIWIGGYEGLLRFDGKKSKTFNEREDGFPSNQINTMYEAGNGDLWIGTNDEGLILYKDGQFTKYGVEQGMPSESVWSISEDSAGNLYVATGFGIVLITPEYRLHLITNQRENPIFAISVTVTGKDELWCVSRDGPVYVMNMEKVLKTYEPGFFNDYDVRSVFCSSNNEVYLGTAQNQVIKVGENGFHLIDLETKTGVNHLYEDGFGRIWVLTDTGMGYLEDGEFHSVDGALIESNLENMIEDYEGNYWFSSSNKGVLHLVRSKFKNMNFALSLPERTVNVTYRFGGDLYIGAEEGLAIIDGKGECRVENSLSQRLRGICIKDMIAGGNGDLWICTYSDYGLVRYNKDGSFAYLTEKDGLPSNKVKRIMVTSDDQVVVATLEGVSVIRDRKVVKNYTAENGLYNTNILSFSEDKDGIIHMGTDGGGILLLDLKKGEITSLTKNDGLLSDVVPRLRYDKYMDGIWVACSNGLCYLGKNGLQRVEKLNGYESGILDIKIIDQDAIWFITAREVMICGKYNLFSDDPLQITRLDHHDGLLSSVSPNARSQLDKEGVLYLSCTKGVWAIRTSSVYHNDTVPKIAINHVLLDDKVLTKWDKLVIPAGVKRLTIDYALLTYSSLSGNRVDYYLDSFGEGKSEVGLDDGTSVSYTNLKPGNYRFVLKGTNKEGIMSETLELAIKKERGFLETPFAKGGLAFLAFVFCIGIGMSLAKGRIRMLKNKNREYETLLKQAVTAVGGAMDERKGNADGRRERIATYALEVAKRLGLSKKEREKLYYAALLRDGDGAAVRELAGRLGVNHEEESDVASMTLKILQIVERYDSMVSEYAASDVGEANEGVMEELRNHAGTRFDYELVDALGDVIAEYVIK